MPTTPNLRSATSYPVDTNIKISDSSIKVNEVNPPQYHTQQKAKFEFDTGSPEFVIITSILLPLITGLLLARKGLHNKIDSLWRFIGGYSVEQSIESEDEIRKRSNFFIANKITITKPGEPESIQLPTDGGDSVDYFIDKIFVSDHPYYMITAPTGVGKSTLLANIYLRYSEIWRLRRPHALYLGSLWQSITTNKIDEMIADGRAAKTILLLDALDEMTIDTKQTNTHEELRKEYEIKWAYLLDHKLSKFKKVIVTAREQFFDNTSGFYSVGQKRFWKIHLQPFGNDTISMYLDILLAGKEDHVKEGITTLVQKLKAQDNALDFVRIPLLLSFIESIWKEVSTNKHTGADLNYLSLYNSISGQWMENESYKIKLGDSTTNKNRLRRTCIGLARSGSNGDTVTLTSLRETEDMHNTASEFKSFSGRSLLIITEKEQEVYYKFIHRSFLEYFHVLPYIDGTESEQGSSIRQYDFGFMLLIGSRWRTKKAEAPSTPQSIGGAPNFMPYDQLEQWVDFLDGLCHSETDRESLPEKLYEILAKEDPQWKWSFQAFTELGFNNDNFWDSKNNKPLPKAARAVRYFKRFVTVIDFEQIPVSEEHLSWFAGSDMIKDLRINSVGDIGSSLIHFKGSTKTIKKLSLKNNSINDDHLAAFDGADRIEYLSLNNNLIKGKGLVYFRDSRYYLKGLSCAGNFITDEFLKYFDGACDLTILDLNKNNLKGEGLVYFSQSTGTLQTLTLEYNKITDDHLKYFEGADRIERLFLSNNKLKGNGLIHFSHCINSLVDLTLGNNEIADDYLKCFDGANKIQNLHLYNNKLKGSGLIYFTNSTGSLRGLLLSDNDITDEHLCYFNGADKIETLHLHNNQLEGDGLIHFSNSNSSLITLLLSGNDITDEHLRYFDRADKIETLHMDNNMLNGEGLIHFTRSKSSLTTLLLSGNYITDKHLSYFDGADKIKTLHLDNNQLKGDGLIHFTSSNSSLTVLLLSGNDITDEHLSYFDGADKIEVLHLDNNQLKGDGLIHFARSNSSLTTLLLSGNEITDEHLRYFSGADKIENLRLDSNKLKGNGLAYFSKCVHSLIILSLHNNNEITDEHLRYFSGADKIKKLFLSKNKIRGNGLIHFSRCAKNLIEVLLWDNEITDEYLKYLDGADKIKTLYLNNNNLKGDGLAYLSHSRNSLEVLWLSDNQITDEYLSVYKGAPRLHTAYLHGNKLTKAGEKDFLDSLPVLEDYDDIEV